MNGRFLIEVRSSAVCELPLFYKLIDRMNLADLPTLSLMGRPS